MLKLVSEDVPNIEQFMKKYKVKWILSIVLAFANGIYLLEMDHPAALHRIEVGLPATIEHASEGGSETAQAVAETTQVSSKRLSLLISYIF